MTKRFFSVFAYLGPFHMVCRVSADVHLWRIWTFQKSWSWSFFKRTWIHVRCLHWIHVRITCTEMLKKIWITFEITVICRPDEKAFCWANRWDWHHNHLGKRYAASAYVKLSQVRTLPISDLRCYHEIHLKVSDKCYSHIWGKYFNIYIVIPQHSFNWSTIYDKVRGDFMKLIDQLVSNFIGYCRAKMHYKIYGLINTCGQNEENMYKF